MTGIYLLLGSNLGNREDYLRLARNQLVQSVGLILSQSYLYQTEAWRMQQSPAFLNQVLLIKSERSPLNLLKVLLNIETDLGRIRQEQYVDRTLDIDILYYNDLILQHEDLVIPHPRINHRRFALTPLAEIAPEFVHPVLMKTNLQLLEQCQDHSSVVRFSSI